MKSDKTIKLSLLAAIIASSIVPLFGYAIVLLLTVYILLTQNLNFIFLTFKNNKYFTIFLLYMALNLAISDYKVHSFVGILFVLLTVTLFLVIRKYANTIEDCLDIFKYFTISNIIISILGIIQFYFFKDIMFSSGWIDSDIYSSIHKRAYSTLLNPNVLAGYLVFSIGLFITALEDIKTKKINIIAIILSSFCLILTYSRGAWITLFSVIGLIYVYRRKLVYFLYGILFYATAVIINGSAGFERMSIYNTLHDNSLLYRIEIYKTMMKIIKDNFWFGTGINTMSHYINNYSEIIKAPVYHGHNIILNILGETGFIGIIFFGIITVNLFKKLYYIKKHGNDFERIALQVFLSFTSILIHGLIDAVIMTPQFLFFATYIFAVITNIEHIVVKLNDSKLNCSRYHGLIAGGELDGTRNIYIKKSYFRAGKKHFVK
ncbi:MAG: hypothetical protein PWQ37_2537 [Candidatus Petromonas sp.]|jgi:putative inorganic carbon (HCO3(-)) transporter|nr:hypothetical protein [Candidatus Petromonas sp.]